VLTGKSVRREYELRVLAQSTIILSYKIKNTNNFNTTLVSNLKRYTNKTVGPTKTKLKTVKTLRT